MVETLKLPSSTRFSRGADRSNTQWQRDLAVMAVQKALDGVVK
jgi:hypothetical protein